MRDEDIDSEYAEALNDTIAEDAAARVVLNKVDRESAIAASRLRVDEVNSAIETAISMDGTDETVDAYLEKPPYDLEKATPTQKKQIHVVKEELKREFDL